MRLSVAIAAFGLLAGSVTAFADSAASPSAAPAPPASVGNAYLQAAIRLYADIDYEKALEQLARARAVPGTSAMEMAEIEKYTGLVKFELGDASASDSFRAALALNPNAVLPPEVSPKIKAEWTSLKQEMDKARQAQAAEEAHAQPVAPPPVVPPPPAPAAPAPSPPPSVATARPDVPPASASSPNAVDLHPASNPESSASAVTSPAPAPSSHSLGPWFVLGGGAVAGAAGGVMGYLSSTQTSAARSNPIQLAAQADGQSASHDALAANVLYAVAGVALVTAGIWYFAQ